MKWKKFASSAQFAFFNQVEKQNWMLLNISYSFDYIRICDLEIQASNCNFTTNIYNKYIGRTTKKRTRKYFFNIFVLFSRKLSFNMNF